MATEVEKRWKGYDPDWRKNFKLCFFFTVVEELSGTEPAISTGRMKSSLWGRMPEDLVEKVLLFLPASSQARFCTVCKRWRQIMTSCAFLEQTALIAFCSSDTVSICSPEVPCDEWDVRMKGSRSTMKVHKYSLGMLPAEFRQHDSLGQIFTHGGLLGIAMITDSPKGIRFCVVNPANGTWRELPPVVYDLEPYDWPHISMVAYEHKSFKVFMAWSHRLEQRGAVQVYTRYSVYSSATNAWSSNIFTLREPMPLDVPDEIFLTDFVVSKGEFVHATPSHFLDPDGKVLRMSLDGLSCRALGRPPEGTPELQTQIYHLGASYDSETLYWVRNTCSIFQCGQRTKKWKLVSRPTKELRDKMDCPRSVRCELISAQVVGHLILVVCRCPGLPGKYILAYHILEDSWKLVTKVSYLWECHWFLSSRPEVRVG